MTSQAQFCGTTYDPRGVDGSRRTDDATESTPDQHADDLSRLIARLGAGPVDVFASSGGAVNALALVARHPDQVRVLVAHEPPAAQNLPGREQSLAACLDVHEGAGAGGLRDRARSEPRGLRTADRERRIPRRRLGRPEHRLHTPMADSFPGVRARRGSGCLRDDLAGRPGGGPLDPGVGRGRGAHEDVDMTGSTVAREVVVHGRVQGVGFRAYCQQEAEQQGLAGWVTNEPDGSVRAWFEGSAPRVEAMLAWCGHGPPSARVERVDAMEHEPRGLTRFDVR